jgi:hypothetical protein
VERQRLIKVREDEIKQREKFKAFTVLSQVFATADLA